MAKDTAIEWTDHTWNPWVGCRKVSQGCKNCYMFRDQRRFGNDPTLIRRTSKDTFYAPLKWDHAAQGVELVFTCSWSDFFLEEADEWREDAWRIIDRTPYLTYQILTKRPENILSRLPEDWMVRDGYANVWIGVSAENQEQYDRRIPLLLDVPARVHFISAEPLLGPIEMAHWVNWVITGGESGPDARPMDPEWAKMIRDYCVENKIAYFHKQHGGHHKVNGHWGGRELEGRTWDQMPWDWELL